MIEQRPPSEQDLHAYIDGHLESAAAARVAAYLACHPETAALVEAYRAQNAGLHALYDHVLDEPLPEEMAGLLRRRRSATVRRVAALVAAAVALVLMSTAAGWWLSELRHGGDRASPAALVAEAQRAHRLFSSGDYPPGELGAQRDAGLAQSLSKRIGAAVTLPDAQRAGLSLRSVHLLPTDSGIAAFLLYRDGAGRPASLFVAAVAAADAPPQAESSDDVTTLYRVANGLGYVLTVPRGADPAVTIALGMAPSR